MRSVLIGVLLSGWAGMVTAQASGLIINEFQSRNFSFLQDEDGDFEDWLEVWNSGTEPLNLLNYRLSDDQTNLARWAFPDTVLEPDAYLVVFLSGKDRSVAGGVLHANFSLGDNEALILSSPQLEVLQLVAPVHMIKDISYGRPVGAEGFAYFGEPTPGAPNVTQAFSGICDPPVFSHPTGFYTESLAVEIDAPAGTSVVYTLDGSEPSIEAVTDPDTYVWKNQFPLAITDPFGPMLTDTLRSFLYTEPLLVADRSAEPDRFSQKSSTNDFNPPYIPDVPSFKGTVIRARTTAPDKLPSEIVSRVFYVHPAGWNRYNLPIASLVATERDLVNYFRGIHTAGRVFEVWRQNNPTEFPPPIFQANYGRTGNLWEREGWFEWLDPHTQSVQSFGQVGLRIHGASSRRFPRKSFRIYARSDFGNPDFEYPFFESHPTQTFERLILSNSGNDERYTNLRHMLITQLAKPMEPLVAESRPAYVFVNGEFYGLNNLREYLDDNYFRIQEGIEQIDLDLINGVEVSYGSAERYLEISQLCASPDFNFEQFIQYVDLPTFLDVFAVNMLVANADMLPKNTLWWRNKSLAPPHDRFFSALIDQDRGLGHPLDTLLSEPQYDMVSHYLTGNNEVLTPYLQCFRAAMEETSARHAFLNRSADALNAYFAPHRVAEKTEAFQSLYLPHYSEHIERWSGDDNVQSLEDWNAQVDEIIAYAHQRPVFHREHLSTYFQTAGTFDMVLDVSSEAEGFVRVSTLDILPSTPGILIPTYPWEGVYFKNTPIPFEAVALPGYVFSHWEGALSGTSASDTAVFIADSVYINAVFTPDSTVSSTYIATDMGIRVFPNPTLNEITVTSSKISIVDIVVTDLSGRQILNVSPNPTTTCSIPLNGTPGMYLVRVRLLNGHEINLKVNKQG